MYLEKWYADVVASGRVRIFYRANLRIGGISVGYSGALSPNKRSGARVDFRGAMLPRMIDGEQALTTC